MNRDEKIGYGLSILGVIGDAVAGVVGAVRDRKDESEDGDGHGPVDMTAGWAKPGAFGGRRRKRRLARKPCKECDE